jgi:WD40 repeat protein
LIERARALCPAVAEQTRALEVRNREASEVAAKGAGTTPDELWAASEKARAAGDTPRARRLASLAARQHSKRGTLLTAWNGVAELQAIALSHDGAMLLGQAAGELLLIDARTLAPRQFLRLEGELPRGDSGGARFSPRGDRVAIARQGELFVYDVGTGLLGRKLEWADQEIRSFAFSADGESIITGSRAGFDAVVRRFDLRSGDSLAEYVIKDGREVSALAASQSGSFVACSTRSGGLELLDAKKLTKVRGLGKKGALETADSLVFSPSGDRLASIHSRMALEIWNVTTGAPIATAALDRPWSAPVLGFSGDGGRIRVTGGTWGDALMELDSASGRALAAKSLPRGSAVLSADGEVIAVSDRGGGLSIVEAASGKLRVAARRVEARLEDLAVTDGHLAMARELGTGSDSRIDLFVEGAQTERARSFSVPGYKATLAFSRLGQRLAGSFGGRGVRAWEMRSGAPLELADAPEWVDQLAFASPEVLRGAGGPFELKFFSTRIGARAWTTEFTTGRDRGRRALAVVGDQAVFTAADQLTRYDFEKRSATALGAAKDLRAVGLSGDGKALIVSTAARGVERWSLPSGEPKRLLTGRCKDGPISVSADGSSVLIRCSYREFALLSSAGQVTAPWEASRAELAPSGKVVVVEHEGRVVIAGADLKERVSLRFGAMPGAVVASGPGGVIERFGGESDLADRTYCRVGDRVAPFELCEDLLYRDDLVRDALWP